MCSDLLFDSYLSKLADQTMILISPEHSRALVWNEAEEDDNSTEDVEEHDERVDRMFSFEVAKTKEEDEGVIPKPGFTVCIWVFIIDTKVTPLSTDISPQHYRNSAERSS